jgi:hypothetical protein
VLKKKLATVGFLKRCVFWWIPSGFLQVFARRCLQNFLQAFLQEGGFGGGFTVWV